MKYFTPKYTSVISSCIDDCCDQPTASDKVFTKWRTRVRLHLYLQSSIGADLQRFFKEYFVDTDLDDDDVEFESFTPEDIRGRPIDLINSCRDRPIASDSHIVIGLPGATGGVIFFRGTHFVRDNFRSIFN